MNSQCLKLNRAHSIPFNSSNVGNFFLELNSKGLHQSSGKEKESCCLLFPSSTKREIRQFHVVVVQRRQRNVQKSVMHVQSCCFANLNLLLFRRSHCRRRRRRRRRRRCLSSLPVRKCVQFSNWCSAWLNHLPLAQHVLGGATFNLSTVSDRTYIYLTEKTQKIIVKQTHLLLCMKGLTLVAVFY